VTVEMALAAVEGFATATETAVVPAELAAVTPVLPSVAKAAAQPVRLRQSAALTTRMQGEKENIDPRK
jgi:hypothetical protein